MQVAVIVSIIGAVASVFGAFCTFLIARFSANRQDRRTILDRRLQRLQVTYKSLLLRMKEVVDPLHGTLLEPGAALPVDALTPIA